MKESTYIMLKPDALERNLAGEIISRIERIGYKIINCKMMRLDEAVLREHYAHLTDKPFYPTLQAYMMRGPVLGMIVEGENAVAGMRKIMGATKFDDSIPGTIRGDFSTGSTENLIHGSDSVENAQIEIRRFFGENIYL